VRTRWALAGPRHHTPAPGAGGVCPARWPRSSWPPAACPASPALRGAARATHCSIVAVADPAQLLCLDPHTTQEGPPACRHPTHSAAEGCGGAPVQRGSSADPGQAPPVVHRRREAAAPARRTSSRRRSCALNPRRACVGVRGRPGPHDRAGLPVALRGRVRHVGAPGELGCTAGAGSRSFPSPQRLSRHRWRQCFEHARASEAADAPATPPAGSTRQRAPAGSRPAAEAVPAAADAPAPLSAAPEGDAQSSSSGGGSGALAQQLFQVVLERPDVAAGLRLRRWGRRGWR